MASLVPHDTLARFWEAAPPVFSHINYGSFLGGEAKTKRLWQQRWLNRFCTQNACVGAQIVEYGIGGGLLGEVLLGEYNASHYAGIDISARSRNLTAIRLAKRFPSHRFSVHDTTWDFGRWHRRISFPLR